MGARRLPGVVNQVYSLLGRGLTWSYRRYGLKGAVGFLAIVGVAYYLASDRIDRLLDEGSD
jgi:hypothetical protein